MKRAKKKGIKIIREIESKVKILERVESRSLSLEDTLDAPEEFVEEKEEEEDKEKLIVFPGLVAESSEDLEDRETTDFDREGNRREDRTKENERVKVYGESRSAKIYGSSSESRGYQESRKEGYSDNRVDNKDESGNKKDGERKPGIALQGERDNSYQLRKEEDIRNEGMFYSDNRRRKGEQF